MKIITFCHDPLNELFSMDKTGVVETIELDDSMVAGGFSGLSHTDEAKKDISDAMIERWKHSPVILSDEVKRGISQSLTGRKQSKETIQKRVEKNRGQKRTEEQKRNISDGQKPVVDYVVLDPDGNTHHITKFNRFCEEHNLSAPLLNKVMKGQRNHHKGWRKL